MRLLSTLIIVIIIITDGCLISAHHTRNDVTNDVIAIPEVAASDVTRNIKLLETLFRWYMCKKEIPLDRRHDAALEMKVSCTVYMASQSRSEIS